MHTSTCEQRSAEWHQCRTGRITASRIEPLLKVNANGSISKASRDLQLEILAEQLTGFGADHYVSKEMQWGIDNEPIARARYELKFGVYVEEIGFVYHPKITMAGCSPDGLVGEDGLIEIKCPNTVTFMRHCLTQYKNAEDVPYYYQMQWQMACTGRCWCDLVFFDPRLPDDLQLHVMRIERNHEFITSLESSAEFILDEISEMRRKLEGTE